MNNLFKNRVQKHFIELSRYYRYVFNDHLMIAMFFFAGALGYAYSNYLGTITTIQWWYQPLVIITLLITVRIGRLAVLTADADKFFLFPQELGMQKYLKAALNYSYWLGMIPQILVLLVLVPFLGAALKFTVVTVFELVVLQLILKRIQLDSKFEKVKLTQNKWANDFVNSWLVPLVTLVIAIYITPLLGILIAFLWLLVVDGRFVRSDKWLINWNQLISAEDNRMLTIYRFFNLFVTVPFLTGKVHRRAYLDFLFRHLRKIQKNLYTYMYARSLIRSDEFGGLIGRLTIIAAIIIGIVPDGWLRLTIFLLTIYLIGVQMIPFYWQYDNAVISHLYPVSSKQQRRSFEKILRIVRILVTVILGFVAGITGHNFGWLLTYVLTGLLECLILTKWYATNRIMNNKRN